MKIKAIELINIRGFRHLERTNFSESINVFIGPNNSGKSTILNSIFLLQRDNIITKNDITIGENQSEIKIFFKGNIKKYIPLNISESILQNAYISYIPLTNEKYLRNLQGQNLIVLSRIQEVEPENLIYPYLSKRKAVSFQDQINERNTNFVSGNFTNLYSKIDRIITPQYQPANSQYINACKEILGFEISTLASPEGKKGVYFVHNQQHIPLTAMGEGVTNIIGLITDLCVAENKIFIIEELENDIHPAALKSLLKFIVEKSENNQFFISTHSNIVMKYLGSVKYSKIFSINSQLGDDKLPNLFISKMNEIPDNSDDRKLVLESLGYEFNDFGLWTAWLFLEESSAEILIRDWFIKWFTPKLKDKLRTFSSSSLSQVIPKFDDFNKLFVFLHLEPIYKNKVWVIIDHGEEEKKIIERLKENYVKSGWNEENFSQFTEHDFEKYYPIRFRVKVESILKNTNVQSKRIAKKDLLNEVKEWILQDEKLAKEEFKISAEPVIIKLKEIEKKVTRNAEN